MEIYSSLFIYDVYTYINVCINIYIYADIIQNISLFSVIYTIIIHMFISHKKHSTHNLLFALVYAFSNLSL